MIIIAVDTSNKDVITDAITRLVTFIIDKVTKDVVGGQRFTQPSRYDVFWKASGNDDDQQVRARALQDRWSRPSGDGDVICTCSGDDFCVGRANAKHWGSRAKRCCPA